MLAYTAIVNYTLESEVAIKLHYFAANAILLSLVTNSCPRNFSAMNQVVMEM